MPVTVAVYTRKHPSSEASRSDGDLEVARYTIHVKERDETFELAAAGELADLVFDDECGVLCELEVEKDARLWAHQSRIAENSAARWRAIDGLREHAQDRVREEAADDSADPRNDRTADRAEARAALIGRLEHDDQPMVRAKAASACTFPEARGALLAALSGDADAGVRLACARALGREELDSREIEIVNARLERERSPAVRAELLRLLGVIDAPEASSR
jgi:hypothetical protein